MSEKNKITILTRVGWTTFIMAFAISLLRAASGNYPADKIFLTLFLIFLSIFITVLISLGTGFFFKKRLAFSIVFGGMICPIYLLIAISSLFFIGPAPNGASVVIYYDSNINDAQVVENFIYFDQSKFSAERYWLTRDTPVTDYISIEYSFDGDALEFHEIYYGRKDKFHLISDSVLTSIIRQSTKDCRGMLRSDQVKYLDELLLNSSMPENVKFTGKIEVSGRASLSGIID